MKTMLPVARSDIHVHLSLEHASMLFGVKYRFTKLKDLTIPGQYACNETVSVLGPAGRIDNVVIVGPERSYTQVEVSGTNAAQLGLDPPVRRSGNLAGSPGCTLKGPAGTVKIQEGVIKAHRHIHMHTRDLQDFGVKNGDIVRVRIPGQRGLVFENVLIKGGYDMALEMHIDFDEGYAAGAEDFQLVELLR